MQGKTRRFIYLFLIISLIFPLTTGYTLKPAPSSSVDMFFNKVVYVTLQYTKTTDKENSFIDSMVSDYLPIEGGNNDEVTDDQVAQAIVDTLTSLERSE